MIYGVDAEQLESAIKCGMTMGSTNVYKLTSADLRAFLNKEAKYYKDVLI